VGLVDGERDGDGRAEPRAQVGVGGAEEVGLGGVVELCGELLLDLVEELHVLGGEDLKEGRRRGVRGRLSERGPQVREGEREC
jgi:hypothetical protein